MEGFGMRMATDGSSPSNEVDSIHNLFESMEPTMLSRTELYNLSLQI